MTTEQIDLKIAELKKQKKQKILQQKAREVKQKKLFNEKKRKLETRAKIIIGGYFISIPGNLEKFLNSEKLRDQDKKVLQEYCELLKKI